MCEVPICSLLVLFLVKKETHTYYDPTSITLIFNMPVDYCIDKQNNKIK